MASSRLAKYSWFVLGFTVLVIVLGAVVRATGSGAGCGSNWPDCNGSVLPLSGTAEEAIEFTHRATSGLALIAVAVLYVAVRRAYDRSDPIRRAAFFSGVFILTEALIGAGLVLFEWVADDTSVARAVSVGLHLVNTFLLVGALTLTAWWLSGGAAPRTTDVPRRRWLVIGAGGLLLVGAMGAITALGDTLFPPESLVEGIRSDFSAAENFLVRLRWIHPILAVATAWYLAYLGRNREMIEGSAAATRLGSLLAGIVGIQIVAGVVNVVLLAPLWMQIVHLVLADATWILFVLFSSESLVAAGGRRGAEVQAA